MHPKSVILLDAGCHVGGSGIPFLSPCQAKCNVIEASLTKRTLRPLVADPTGITHERTFSFRHTAIGSGSTSSPSLRAPPENFLQVKKTVGSFLQQHPLRVTAESYLFRRSGYKTANSPFSDSGAYPWHNPACPRVLLLLHLQKRSRLHFQ